MNEIKPKPEDILARLDWQTITCQRQDKPCSNPARLAVEMHAVDCCESLATNDFGNVIGILCKPCYAALIRETNRYLYKLGIYGRPHCRDCLAPLRTTTDILRAVMSL